MRIDPLVEPGPELAPEDRARYARQLALPAVGELGQRRLGAARVLVVGAGGLGSPVLLYLAAAGVGTIGIVDVDAVEVSNLQRQVIHSTADLGRSKVASAAESVRALNPGVVVEEHDYRMTVRNAAELATGYDLVVDGSDTLFTRYLVADACEAAGKPLVWGSVLALDGQVTVFWSEAPDGAARVLRDLHPDTGNPFDTFGVCATEGVSPAVCGLIGSAMAGEAISLITGGEVLLGRVLVYSGQFKSWAELEVLPAVPSVE
ncbi:HesA/MoeB/ThiF family protein [Agromyces seonyuensis]|uniref:THIF-type NAD/FAD binding fold domain-containing protein n=1 Tax=Agromyces seonyuensis TaxID=2662446 RepID=A0A6I4NYJ5_9MICO|nr:ThiF family adenylyltransferase [Agromyces seonyuensis]MWB97515.1 hypothetical protein [Agromyces seonyuensis]